MMPPGAVNTLAAGDVVGRWLVLVGPHRSSTRTPPRKVVLARCACGAEKEVVLSSLLDGMSQSCGCYRTDALRSKSSMLSKSREYNVAHGAKQRCNNPKGRDYRHYGGRGVEFRFASCMAMAQYIIAELGRMERGQSIDRIDVNGHYEPGNLRIAFATEQTRNCRSNVFNLDRLDQLARLRAERPAEPRRATARRFAEVTGTPAAATEAVLAGRSWVEPFAALYAAAQLNAPHLDALCNPSVCAAMPHDEPGVGDSSPDAEQGMVYLNQSR